MEMCAEYVKKTAAGLGADLCGIASADQFRDAPDGYRPQDVLPGCQSVIVFAIRSLDSTLSASTTIPYTTMRNHAYYRLDQIALEIAATLESHGFLAVPVPAGEPCVVDYQRMKLRGIISLKHAAVLAGLGKMGKNTLLINDRYGNMLWLGAVLTSAELASDPPAPYEACIPDCLLCLESCPRKALDGFSINQQECGRFAFADGKAGEGWRITCNVCRKVCPRCHGIRPAVPAQEAVVITRT